MSKKKLNVANMLTMLRMILTIPFIIFFCSPLFSSNYNFPSYFKINWQLVVIIIALIIFIVAMITDFVDGKIARKTQITTFGKLFDSISDKMIVNSALIIFSIYKVVPFWIVLPIILRDILIDGIRSFAASKKIIISASYLGKVKTMFLTVSIIILFLLLPLNGLQDFSNTNFYENSKVMWIINIPIIISLVLALISGWEYTKELKKII